jgi:hypothetical protein
MKPSMVLNEEREGRRRSEGGGRSERGQPLPLRDTSGICLLSHSTAESRKAISVRNNSKNLRVLLWRRIKQMVCKSVRCYKRCSKSLPQLSHHGPRDCFAVKQGRENLITQDIMKPTRVRFGATVRAPTSLRPFRSRTQFSHVTWLTESPHHTPVMRKKHWLLLPLGAYCRGTSIFQLIRPQCSAKDEHI